MNRTLTVGLVVTVVGLAGYLLGIGQAFPGRAFSMTAVMVGLLFLAIGWRPGGGVGS